MEIAAKREGVEPAIVYIEVPKVGGSFHHGWTWHDEQGNKKTCLCPGFFEQLCYLFRSCYLVVCFKLIDSGLSLCSACQYPFAS